jgi:hypothetical protein
VQGEIFARAWLVLEHHVRELVENDLGLVRLGRLDLVRHVIGLFSGDPNAVKVGQPHRQQVKRPAPLPAHMLRERGQAPRIR